jgi:predicted deacylase
MLPDDPERAEQTHVAHEEWLRSPVEGWWDAAVTAGDHVRAGARLGVVRSLWGDELAAITAPSDGVVLFRTTSPAIAADGLLLGLGTELSPV